MFVDLDFKVVAPAIASVVTAVLGWLVGRRRNDADIHKIEVDAASVSIKSLRDTIEVLTNEVTVLRREVKELKVQNTNLHNEVVGLREENRQLKDFVGVIKDLLCRDLSCSKRCSVRSVDGAVEIKNENEK